MRGLVLCFVMLGTPLAADTIPVRSGEHDGFTRLVLDLPRALDWTLEATEAGYRVGLSGGPHRFETGSVFQRIDRSRVAAVAGAGDALTLSLACDCAAEAFLAGPNMLVVDIAEKEASREPPEVELDLRTSYARSPDRLPAQLEVLSTLPDPSAQDAARTARVEATRHALARALGTAASNGLLTPSGDTADLSGSETRPGEELRAEPNPPSLAPEGPAPVPAPLKPGLVARTSLAGETQGVSKRSDTCLAASRFDFGVIPTGEDFPARIAAHRAVLFSERDRLKPASALALAKAYLAYGFGAEARAALDLLPPPERPALLLDMARIVDSGAASVAAPRLAGQAGCDTAGALWGLLALQADASPGASNDVNTNAVLSTLSAMPPVLRSTLGPRVAEALVTAGHTKAAASATAIVSRTGQEPSPELGLAAAAVDLAAGDSSAAIEELETAAQDDGPIGARAVTRLIETQLDNDADITRDTALLAAAHEREHRETPLGDALAVSHARALAASGDYVAALAAANGAAPIIDEIYTMALEDTDAVRFATFAIPDRPVESGLARPTALAIAERLIEEGFPDAAQRFLTPQENGQADRAGRLLQARAHLASGRPQRAEALLLGLSGDEADGLRIESLLQQGDLDAARALARQTALPLPTEASTPDVAELLPMTEGFSDAVPSDTSLAAGRALLDDSADLRSQIDGLLDRRPPPAVPAPQEPGGG